jgi:hypothetical protein
MDCWGLSARGTDDLEEGSVPFDDWIDWLGRLIVIGRGEFGETGGGSAETGA